MTGDYKFNTLSLHAGFTPDERHGSAAVPIHQTTSYVFKDTEHAAAGNLGFTHFSGGIPCRKENIIAPPHSVPSAST